MSETTQVKLKTYYASDANGHCGTVQAANKRAAEAAIRKRLGQRPGLTVRVSPHNCPNCGGDNFGVHNGTPVTTGGWHGGLRFGWGRYAGVHMACCTGKRCEDCGHEVAVDPDWD